MKIVTVIPLSRGVFKEQLSYFTSSHVSLGSLISVPLRTQTVQGLVVKIEDAKDLKTRLKSASFSMKKIEKVHEMPLFSQELVEAAEKTADYFATTTADVIEALIPKCVLEAYGNGEIKQEPREKTEEKADEVVEETDDEKKGVHMDTNKDVKSEHCIFQSDDEERFATYKSFIRGSFAKKESVFFCMPSVQRIESVYNHLEKGIAPYTFVLHGKLNRKEVVQTWNNILASKRPVLIIATGNFLAIPRDDIGTVILDFENSSGYKMIKRPLIDYRTFAEIYTQKTKTKLIFGDTFLRVETLMREQQKDLTQFAPPKFRMLEQARQSLVDMKKEGTKEGAREGSVEDKKTFVVISKKLDSLIEHNKSHNEHLFIVTSRKGLYPVTTCGDCGTLVMCDQCSSPMSLHKTNGKPVFVCHKCGNRKLSSMLCGNCGSWKLTPLGIGTQLIESEILEGHEGVAVFRLDGDTATTNKKAKSIAAEFLNTPGSVLIGTEMALPYIEQQIENVAVASIDSLFALPDFRGNERIFNFLLRLYSKARNNFLIQTRNPDSMLFTYIAKGNLLDFYRAEIAERKELNYPPFKTFIKISRAGEKAHVIDEMKKLSEKLGGYEAIMFPAFTQEVKGSYRMHMLIKLDKNAWVDKELLAILRGLPPAFGINIDPENLL
jgi:primosomal protein N' (replication factor Y)